MTRRKRRRQGRARTEAAHAQAQTLIPPVLSLSDLRDKAATDPRYAQLLLLASANLGGPALTDYSGQTLTRALAWLRLNAHETTAEGVVDEVNHCRDFVTETATSFDSLNA